MLEHLQGFFSDFSVAATLPSSAVVRGIFDNGASMALNIMGTDPTFIGQTSDLSALAYGSSMTIGGTAYTVREAKPDGTGITTLTLERA